MKVVHISSRYGQNNTGGAAIAATRLHLAMLNAGIESHFICSEKAEDGPNVYALPRCWSANFRMFVSERIPYYLGRITWRLKKYHLIRDTAILDWGVYMHLVPMFGLEKLLRRLKPDVVHVHWIVNDCITFRQLARIPYPLVMSLHDRYMINALDPCPNEDRRMREGFTKENSFPYERWMVRRKRRFNETRHPAYIAPSQWMCSECGLSVIGRGMKTFYVPNILDLDHFHPAERRTPSRDCVLLFGCTSGTQSIFKGWEDLVVALRSVRDEIKQHLVIRVFGEKSPNRVEEGVRVEFLGILNSAQELCAAYNAADFFVMPSRHDNAPSVKFESWLCGLPVVTFQREGCAEGVVDKVNGWVAPDGDFADYAKGIEYFYGLWQSGELTQMHQTITENARRQYSADNVLAQHLEVYRYQIQTRGDEGGKE